MSKIGSAQGTGRVRRGHSGIIAGQTERTHFVSHDNIAFGCDARQGLARHQHGRAGVNRSLMRSPHQNLSKSATGPNAARSRDDRRDGHRRPAKLEPRLSRLRQSKLSRPARRFGRHDGRTILASRFLAVYSGRQGMGRPDKGRFRRRAESPTAPEAAAAPAIARKR